VATPSSRPTLATSSNVGTDFSQRTCRRRVAYLQKENCLAVKAPSVLTGATPGVHFKPERPRESLERDELQIAGSFYACRGCYTHHPSIPMAKRQKGTKGHCHQCRSARRQQYIYKYCCGCKQPRISVLSMLGVTMGVITPMHHAATRDWRSHSLCP
jgi:hypothetical protein